MKRYSVSAAVAASLAVLVLTRLSWTAIGAAALIGSAGASAAQTSTQRISFARGASSASVRGSIRGEQTIDYVLRARSGDRFTVVLNAGHSNAYMNVIAPVVSEALHIGSISGARFKTVIPSSGDYLVRVYLMRSAARRGERADYSIDFVLRSPATALPATTLPTPDVPPQIIMGTNGTGEVIFDQNRCVAYYNRQGRRTNALPTCRPDQRNRADDAMARYRREQGL
jgi:hypothetical protein